MKYLNHLLLFVVMLIVIIIASLGVSGLSERIFPSQVVPAIPVVEEVAIVEEITKEVPKKSAKKISTKEKKARFYALLLPKIEKVHSELTQRYLDVAQDLKNGTNKETIAVLKKRYKVKSDEDLLLALKPHPRSIVLAQAVLESSWGTSRLFKEANNIFGMKSHRANEPRISSGNRVWFKKFATLEDSIRAYYRIIGKRKEYREFRAVRYVSNDAFEMIEKLYNYAEIGEKYPKELEALMRHNNLVEYDK
jgi:Bax protein